MTEVRAAEVDSLELNGEPHMNENVRRLLDRIRSITGRSDWVQMASWNNFPTAAGLASSASGYACLVAALGQHYGLDSSDTALMSGLARIGSGSACRSMIGGFSKWERGVCADGSDSVARAIVSESHWDLVVLVLVVSREKKDVGSTEGMRRTVQTSRLFQHRVRDVEARCASMEQAIVNRDFDTFASLCMRDSNEMHACCLDSFPPITYLNATSHKIISWVHNLNSLQNRAIAAYTFDAGPNAFIFARRQDLSLLLHSLAATIPFVPSALKDPLALADAPSLPSPASSPLQQVLQQVLLTVPGPGPLLETAQARHNGAC